MLVNFLNRLVNTLGDEGYPDAGASGFKAVAPDEDEALLRKESEFQKNLLTRTTARVIIGL
ncbi:hypothetical protein OHB12_34930 [Nocardia sp. NBC_01730]|uniref:hypothetical protein n=1 Tax=Nocardia sp. NBC_01730 TaxID=2975998 RepID=UPI002E11F0B6|nr:hypothetical protein OHB12_34930 [Nocardia sp. NBC_01730]